MYLNPDKNQQIKRYFFYKLMKLLMTNVNTKTENELQNKIAVFMIEMLKSKGIELRNSDDAYNKSDL